MDLDDEDRSKKLEQKKAEKKQLSAFKDRNSLVELFEKQKAIPLVRVFLTILILVLCIAITGGALVIVISNKESEEIRFLQKCFISQKKKENEMHLIWEIINSLILHNEVGITPNSSYFSNAIYMLNDSFVILKSAHENTSANFNQTDKVTVLLYSEEYSIFSYIDMTLRESESMILELLYRTLYMDSSKFVRSSDVIKPLLYSIEGKNQNNLHNSIMNYTSSVDQNYSTSMQTQSNNYTLTIALSIGLIVIILVVVFFLSICLNKAKTRILNFFVKIPFKVLEEITKSCDDFLYTYQYQSNNKDDTDHATNASLLSSNKEDEEEEESNAPIQKQASGKDPLQYKTKIKFGNRAIKAHCTTMLTSAISYLGLGILLCGYFLFSYWQHKKVILEATRLIYFDIYLLNIQRDASALLITLQTSISDANNNYTTTEIINRFQLNREKIFFDFQSLESVRI